jgi:eukaryotic-like serine/threonine-protein kinase
MTERTIFIEALEITDPVERSGYVDRACAGDAQMRVRVEELLCAHTAPGAFMDRPAMALADPPQPIGEPAQMEVAGYEILEELGRGGMGVVFKARQSSLKRVVALKMLLAGPHAGAAERARLRSEAQAVARLQHPNIVQIFDVGLAGANPYLALEFVAGGSLKARLSGTPLPAQLAVGIVETTARAVHHAHEHGIVHRDLKPANILLQFDPMASPAANEHLSAAVVKIADFGIAKHLQNQALTGAASTVTGALLGTPSYMAPEQATGKSTSVGPSADVYALGAILYELISGRPPFQGETAVDTLQQVRFQEPVPPSRMQPRVARDLETICMKCLEKKPAQRYYTAAALADDLKRFQAGEPIVARPVTVLQRSWRWCRRRPATASLAAAVGLLALTTLGAALWYVQDQGQQRAVRSYRAAQASREINLAMAEARKRRDDAFQETGRPERWHAGMLAALSSLERAEFIVADNRSLLDSELNSEVQQLRVRLDADEAGRLLVSRLEQLRLNALTLVDGKYNPERASERFREETRRSGIDVDAVDSSAVVARIKESPVQAQLVAALDEWAYVSSPALRKRLLALASAADPEPWRARFRLAWTSWNWSELKALAADPVLLEQPTHLIVLLSRLLQRNDRETALRLVRLAQERQPADFWANFALGQLLYDAHHPAAAIGYFRVALVLRPDSAVVCNEIGRCLHSSDDLAGAARAYRDAVALDPRFALAHQNLGVALRAQDDIEGAVAALKQAMLLDPTYASPHFTLGNILREQSDLPGAVAAYRKALALNGSWAEVYVNLGMALAGQGDVPGAIASYRQAIGLNPRLANARNNLGNILSSQGHLAEAIAEYRLAIASDANHAEAHCNLGKALQRQGKFAEALDSLKAGHTLGSSRPDWRIQSASSIKQCERLLALDARLPAILQGATQPASATEALEFARLCQYKGFYATAVRFFRQAFDQQRSITDGIRSNARHQAACCAALAGCGQGADVEELSAEARQALREEARAWLRADLAYWTRIMVDSKKAAGAKTTFMNWQRDADLACVRDEKDLGKLPTDEREKWRQLWAEITELVK